MPTFNLLSVNIAYLEMAFPYNDFASDISLSVQNLCSFAIEIHISSIKEKNHPVKTLFLALSSTFLIVFKLVD